MNKFEHASGMQDRSPAIDFIDQRLMEHVMGSLNGPSVIDEASDAYTIKPAHSHPSTSRSIHAPSASLNFQNQPYHAVIPDQNYRHVEAQSMRFWNDIFSEAMQQLITDSKKLTSSAKLCGGIQDASCWEEVCARLHEAQATYTEGQGTVGKLKRMRRKFADNFSQPAAHIAKMVPDVDPFWTTPVAGTIGLLLQAMDTAAKTREEVLKSLSDLDKTFSNIDSFAATFPTDHNVRQASVSLVVAIFQAVEHAIVFFTQSAGRKAAAAVFKGGDYQKELLNSFTEVQKRSDYLIQKAQNSHYESTRTAIQKILSREDRLLAGQAQVAQQSTEMKNAFKNMIEVYVRERELERRQHQEELRRRNELQKQQDALHARRHQELLSLVHQFQITSRPVSPLPSTLALPQPLPSPINTAAAPIYPTWTAQTLVQLLSVPDISDSDLQEVKELGSTLSQRDKRKADQVLQMDIFTQWMRSLKPAKLLIHGVFRGSRTVSPLSLLTATLTETVRTDQIQFVSLVFFGGRHSDRDEDAFSGGEALIQSFIYQLLQQQPHMIISPSPWELDMERVRQGDLQQLCQLLNLLIHRLPEEVTLFCLIDGMVYYERDEFIDETQYVLTELTRLVGDPTIQANVKLLVTSPWRTEMARQFFLEDHEILHMEGMTSMELTPSASRVIHRHISHTDSDQSSRESSPEPWE